MLPGARDVPQIIWVIAISYQELDLIVMNHQTPSMCILIYLYIINVLLCNMCCMYILMYLYIINVLLYNMCCMCYVPCTYMCTY